MICSSRSSENQIKSSLFPLFFFDNVTRNSLNSILKASLVALRTGETQLILIDSLAASVARLNDGRANELNSIAIIKKRTSCEWIGINVNENATRVIRDGSTRDSRSWNE